MDRPAGVLSRPLLPASIAIYTTVALVAFEGLAVAAALPQIAAELGRVSLLPWVITGYLFTSGVATVVAGPLVDGIGVRTMFRYAVAVFALAGFAAAFVPSMPLMVAARIVQGAGGGLIFAVGLAAVGLVYPAHLVSRAYAANSTVWGVMAVAGPAIAAVMLTVLSWRWIFLVNLPLGILSLIAGWRVLPGARTAGATRRVDLAGTALVTTFTLAILLAVDGLGPASMAWVALAAGAAVAYRAHARRSVAPVLRLAHLVAQPYSSLALTVGLLLCGAVTAHSYLPLYVQGGRGGSPALTAWSVLFFTIGWTLGANASGRALDRKPETGIMAVGLALTVPALAGVWAAAALDAPLWVLFGLYLVAGLGVGAATNAALTLLRAVTSDDQLGRSTAAHQFVRNQGFTLGAAAGGAVLLLVVGNAIRDVEQVRDLLAGDVGEVGATAAAAIADGFTGAALVGALVAAASVPAMVALRRHLGPARAARRSD
jgi:MFS family permease